MGDYKEQSFDFAPKAICIDETAHATITTSELRIALEAYNNNNPPGPRINILTMDACNMGSIEVLYKLKGLIDYVVASSSPVPGSGLNYDFLKQITSSDNALSVARK